MGDSHWTGGYSLGPLFPPQPLWPAHKSSLVTDSCQAPTQALGHFYLMCPLGATYTGTELGQTGLVGLQAITSCRHLNAKT